MSGNTSPTFVAVPVAFEVWDGFGGLIARVEQVDEHAARLEIRELVGQHEWRQLAEAIQSAFDRMDFAPAEDA